MFFFFNDTATTEIYTLPLHDALPISRPPVRGARQPVEDPREWFEPSPWWFAPSRPSCRCWPSAVSRREPPWRDRKSTRLNSSHDQISYAVFCLKKKKKK